jgi:hypothetical protein
LLGCENLEFSVVLSGVRNGHRLICFYDDYALDTDLEVLVILIHFWELLGLIEYGPQKRGRVVGRLAILKGEDDSAIVAVCLRNVGLVSH